MGDEERHCPPDSQSHRFAAQQRRMGSSNKLRGTWTRSHSTVCGGCSSTTETIVRNSVHFFRSGDWVYTILNSRQTFACPRMLIMQRRWCEPLTARSRIGSKDSSLVHKSRTPPGAIQPIQNVTTQGMSGWQSRMIEVVGGIVRHA
jgi:hypothetical protein